MKTNIITNNISYTVNPDQPRTTNREYFKSTALPIWAAIAMSACIGLMSNPATAEESDNIQHYMQPKTVDNTAVKEEPNIKKEEPNTKKEEQITKDAAPSSEQDSQIDPIDKPADGKGKLPTFAQADINGDHVITKEELKNFPYLLQVFDKIDAGMDGKLEQHEYQNLKMETKREGEIS